MLQNSHFVPLAFTLPSEFLRYFVYKNSFIGLAVNEQSKEITIFILILRI